MHVYLREEPVRIRMREVSDEGLVAPEAGLVAVAFFAEENERPSFRAFLPMETLAVLHEVTASPVKLGLLAEEPDEGTELQAMVGMALPLGQLPEGMVPPEALEGEEPSEPWQTGGGGEAWRGEGWGEGEGGVEGEDRTVLLAFAPLVRLARRHPDDFGEELADLLESALAGATRPSLEARVDRMLGL
jgi:hypothetical protein